MRYQNLLQKVIMDHITKFPQCDKLVDNLLPTITVLKEPSSVRTSLELDNFWKVSDFGQLSTRLHIFPLRNNLFIFATVCY